MADMVDKYTKTLQDALPTGWAWTREPTAILTLLLTGLAVEMARVENRAWQLLDEIDPRTTLELLSDWERVCGLPDPCTTAPTYLQERRDAVVAKLNARGGQTKQYFIDQAAQLGFVITIDEFRPFQADISSAGDACFSEEWRFAFRVNSALNTIREFRASNSEAGDPLRWWGNEILECLIRRLKPAHTHVIFAYT